MRGLAAPVVKIGDMAALTQSEQVEISARCQATNMAIYQCDTVQHDPDRIRSDLRAFADGFGLSIAEKHRSSGAGGIVALTVSHALGQRGYIPYSSKSMNWHTDGYYNGPDEQIRAMVLHCVTPAKDGGQNQLLDPEIAYIRLRDENPQFIAALMHPAAMTIPANHEASGTVRAQSVGPVFSVDPGNGRLLMRYTARTRSISWRDDPVTIQAAAFLQSVLTGNDPLMQTITFAAGQGVLCNNVLHNRTGFAHEMATDGGRLIFRVRFHNRVEGRTQEWPI